MKYILISCLLLLTSCSSILLPEPQDIEVISGSYVIEASDGFDILYDSGATKMVREYFSSGSIIINGSYFWKTSSAGIVPAWLWIENWIEKYPLRTDDPNLSHVVIVSGSTLEIPWNQEAKISLASCLLSYSCDAFQAGPLVLSGNTLESFSDSWHTSGVYPRTLIGMTRSGKTYFFIFTTPISLHDVWEKIIQDDRFTRDPLTLLNLDGWPSTAYFDGEQWFRANEKLPIIIRIKK